MAPLDPDYAGRSNTLPLAYFSGHILFVAGLTTHILHTIRRAARSLPPSSTTRAQQALRLRNAGIFSTLAALSIATVTTFAVAWRALSYFEWAEKGSHHSHPGSIWQGWYGTGDEGVGSWRLGDWWSDVDRIEQSDAKVLASPEAFFYLYQHYVGLTAAAIFFGVEGRRRNLPMATIASFVALSAFGSLGLSLNLFFVLMLFTPMAVHDDDSIRHDALFAPKAIVLYIPVIGALAVEEYLPVLLAHRANLNAFRLVYLGVPLFLAFAPEIVPKRWGKRHASKASAHHSYVQAFYVLGVTSLLLHWKQLVMSLLVNTPPARSSVYDLFTNMANMVGQGHEKPNRLMAGLSNMGQQLKHVSGHPAISVTGTDVAFTVIGLLTWTFLRQLNVEDMLDNSILSFLAPPKGEKHVAFKDTDERRAKVEEEYIPPVTPRKRGRPRKNPATTPPPATAAANAALRRSTRRRTADIDEDDAQDSTYEPPVEVAEALEQTEMDASPSTEDLVAGGESTALALVLSFLGGLGHLAASVLGAEVTGST